MYKTSVSNEQMAEKFDIIQKELQTVLEEQKVVIEALKRINRDAELKDEQNRLILQTLMRVLVKIGVIKDTVGMIPPEILSAAETYLEGSN